MNLFPDGTVAISFILFIVTFLIMSSLIVRPVLRILSVREKEIFGAEARAEEKRKEAKTNHDSYYADVRQFREQGSALRNAERIRALQQEKVTIGEAQEAQRGKMEKMDKLFNEEITRVREELWKEHRALAKKVAEQIIGRQL